MKQKVLIVEDDPAILTGLLDLLEGEGFAVVRATTGPEALARHAEGPQDLVLLDVMIPEKSGYDVCREIRRTDPVTPIIMLTAKGQERDKVKGLDLGADDYLTKPFSPKELIARIKAVLRRTTTSKQMTLSIGNLSIDPERFEVMIEQKPVTLTPVEFKILLLLVQNHGKVFSRERILDHLWGNEKTVVDRTVDVHIKNLRDKLGPAEYLIKNIRGVGYKLQA